MIITNNNSLCTNMLMLYLGIILCNCKYLLPEKLIERLTTNRQIQHIVAFVSIFIMTLLSDQSPPKDNFIKALLIYIWFILITKVNLQFHLVILVSLVMCAVKEKLFKLNKTDDEKKNKKFLQNLVNDKVFYMLIILFFTLVGNFYYYNKNKIQHSVNFDIFKFLFGGKE